MPGGLVGLNSAEFNWAWSVVEAVTTVTDRAVRWRGHVIVHETGFSPGPRAAVDALRSADGPVILPERLARAVREATARHKAGASVQDRSAELVEATGHASSQVVALSSPMYDAIHMLDADEAAFDTGLADVWTQERLREVWPHSESAALIPAERVPDFSFAGRDPVAASAARDVIAELARQLGREPADFAAISDQLIAVKPDQRWDAVVRMLPGTDGLSGDDRLSVAENLREDFGEAIKQGNPGAGTSASPAAEAVRAVTTGPRSSRLDPQLAGFAQDPAMRPAHGAIMNATRGAADRAATGNQPSRERPQTPGLGG
ncbi:MAG TPA: hypothetical protein VFI00_09125 [Kribbella sp.]|nr:hypothetical protein [Kribbella sp.]